MGKRGRDLKDGNVLVSIIVPVYGTEAYLPACIDSLCKQTYGNIQIVLVDDGSPDDCPKICDDYAKKDPRIIVIHQKNKGVSGARNAGLQRASGKYIMFVDSDDTMRREAVDTLLKDSLCYDADIVWAPIQYKSDKNDDEFGRGKYTVLTNEEALVKCLHGVPNMNSVWSKMFKSDFIAGLTFEEGRSINEDGYFMFQCYTKKPLLVRHDVSLYHYTVRQDSSSRQKFSDKYLDMLYFCEKKKRLIADLFPQYENEFRSVEMLTHLQLLDILCSSTDKRNEQYEKICIKKVCELRTGHKPFNKHYAQLAWIVAHGLYPLYKKAIRLKYHKKHKK